MIDLDSTDAFKCISVIQCDAMLCRVMVLPSFVVDVDVGVERESKVTINLFNNFIAKVLFTFLRQTSSKSNLHFSWMHSTALFEITFIHFYASELTNERTNQLLIKRFSLGYWLPYAVNLLSCVSSFWCAHTRTHTARFIVTLAELSWTELYHQSFELPLMPEHIPLYTILYLLMIVVMFCGMLLKVGVR